MPEQNCWKVNLERNVDRPMLYDVADYMFTKEDWCGHKVIKIKFMVNLGNLYSLTVEYTPMD